MNNIKHNITVSDEARDHLLKHYMEPDASHPSKLRSIPTFDYVLAYKDGAGNVIEDAIVGYILVNGSVHNMINELISQFDNEKKFFAISFQGEFDDDKNYLVEYFDGITYIFDDKQDIKP